MAFPAFFDEVPALRVQDPLADLLGAATDGVIEYHYADAVRLAGHSCPTVAGAWLSACAGLRALYADQLPQRGGVSVYLADQEDQGVTGVIGQVATLLTGATGAGGFKGLAGRYARNNLLSYGEPAVLGMRLRRNDSGQTVEVRFSAATVSADPAQGELIGAVLHGQADAGQRRRFGELWQDRVRRILLQHANDPAVLSVQMLPPAA